MLFIVLPYDQNNFEWTIIALIEYNVTASHDICVIDKMVCNKSSCMHLALSQCLNIPFPGAS
jgi:hypothetical protein